MSAPTITLALAAETADPARRRISGRAAWYDQPAPSSPPSTFTAGSIRYPEDTQRVKLLVDHDDTQPVGYAVSLTDDGEGITAEFHVPETPEGDRALQQAAHGLRDGLSVRVLPDDDGYTLTDDGHLTVTAGRLLEISLCALPAQDDARVSDVAAKTSDPTPTPTDKDKDPAMSTEPTTEPATTGPAAPVTATTEPAPAPQAPPVIHTPRAITASRAASMVASVMSRGGSAADVRAALDDVTPSSLPDSEMEDPFLRNQFLGEVWTAAKTERPMIDLFGTPKPITGLKVYGYRWETRPEVDEYDGDKAEIPTNTPKITPVEASVKRTAGGWDTDRIYTDLGDSSLIEALWQAAVEDYRGKTEADVVAEVASAATTADAADDLPAALVSVGSTAAGIGANISGLAMATDVWAAFAGLTRDEVPWWLGSGDNINLGTTTGTVGNIRLFAEPSLTSGQVLAVDSRAATFHEKNPPVRVNAVDLPHGGVDLGLFGYHALIVNDPRAIITAEVGSTSGGGGDS